MKKPAIMLISITAVFLMIIGSIFIVRISKIGTINLYSQNALQSQSINEDPIGVIKININTATAEELQDLPGIGPSTADAIIEYREENGPFKRKSDLLKVSGIGEKTYEQIKSFINVTND